MKTDRVPDALKDKWASRREAAKALELSVATVDRLVKAERLKTRLYEGGRVFVSRESIQAFLAPFLK